MCSSLLIADNTLKPAFLHQVPDTVDYTTISIAWSAPRQGEHQALVIILLIPSPPPLSTPNNNSQFVHDNGNYLRTWEVNWIMCLTNSTNCMVFCSCKLYLHYLKFCLNLSKQSNETENTFNALLAFPSAVLPSVLQREQRKLPDFCFL